MAYGELYIAASVIRHPSGRWYAMTPDGGFIQGSLGSKRHAEECARDWDEANWEY